MMDNCLRGSVKMYKQFPNCFSRRVNKGRGPYGTCSRRDVAHDLNYQQTCLLCTSVPSGISPCINISCNKEERQGIVHYSFCHIQFHFLTVATKHTGFLDGMRVPLC